MPRIQSNIGFEPEVYYHEDFQKLLKSKEASKTINVLLKHYLNISSISNDKQLTLTKVKSEREECLVRAAQLTKEVERLETAAKEESNRYTVVEVASNV